MGKTPKMHELFKAMVSERNLIDGRGVWQLIYDNIWRLFEHGVMLDDLDDDSSRFRPDTENLLGIKNWDVNASPSHGLVLSVSVIFEDSSGDILGTDDCPCTYVCPARFLWMSDEDLDKVVKKYKYDDEEHENASDVESRELAELARLKAKYESPTGDKHTCANCALMKKKHDDKWYECWCGGELHSVGDEACGAWESKGSNSTLLKHLKGDL